MYKILANTLFLGKEVVYMPTCHSTNDTTRELVSHTDKKEGLMVITDAQTQGKGQRGNTWSSEHHKNLTFSLLLKPSFLQVNQQFYLNMISSLAVVETLKNWIPDKKVQVKWPNDVLVDKKKICGILIENSLTGTKMTNSIVGVGLNVNQVEWDTPNATSLIHHVQKELELAPILEQVIGYLEQSYIRLRSGDLAAVKVKYLANLYGFKEPVKLYSSREFFGEILDIDDRGRVIVADDHKSQVFNVKEIRFVLS